MVFRRVILLLSAGFVWLICDGHASGILPLENTSLIETNLASSDVTRGDRFTVNSRVGGDLYVTGWHAEVPVPSLNAMVEDGFARKYCGAEGETVTVDTMVFYPGTYFICLVYDNKVQARKTITIQFPEEETFDYSSQQFCGVTSIWNRNENALYEQLPFVRAKANEYLQAISDTYRECFHPLGILTLSRVEDRPWEGAYDPKMTGFMSTSFTAHRKMMAGSFRMRTHRNPAGFSTGEAALESITASARGKEKS